MCARAAAVVHGFLVLMGFKPRLCVGEAHVFSMIDDYVIDITATQYAIAEEVLITKKANLVEKAYNIKYSSTKLHVILKYLQNLPWYAPERPVFAEYSEIPQRIHSEMMELA